MTGRLLIVEAGKELFAVRLEEVSEVLEHAVRYPIPLAPPFLDRCTSANGRLTPVLDTGLFLGWGATNPDGRILVMAGGDINLGLQVDRVADIITDDQIAGEQPTEEKPFSALLDLPGGQVPLLSVERLLQMIEQALALTGAAH